MLAKVLLNSKSSDFTQILIKSLLLIIIIQLDYNECVHKHFWFKRLTNL